MEYNSIDIDWDKVNKLTKEELIDTLREVVYREGEEMLPKEFHIKVTKVWVEGKGWETKPRKC